MEGGRLGVYLPGMERGPFAGFYLVSELPSSGEGVQRWAVRHSDGRLGEVLFASGAVLETASKMPQGGPWGVVLTGEDDQGGWILLPGELTCSLTQLRAKISARGAFALGHLLLEALDSVHDAGEHHGGLSPEWVGFDSEGVLRVRARPDASGVTDIDESASPQDTDCWSVGGLIYFLLGGDWPPTEAVSMPDFGGMDASRARLALSGLLRKNPRLRLKPARFARQAVAAALQDIEAAEEELRALLAEHGCGGALRDTAPVLPTGLDSDANQALIQAFTKAVAPGALDTRPPEPLPIEEPKTENRSPIQIELALPAAESLDDDPREKEDSSPSDDPVPEPEEAEVLEEGSLDEEGPEQDASDSEEAPIEETQPAELEEDSLKEPPVEPEEEILEEEEDSLEEPSVEPESDSSEDSTTASEHLEDPLEAEPSDSSPIRLQIALPQEEPTPAATPEVEVGKQPLEVEPFRMPLPEPAAPDNDPPAVEADSPKPVAIEKQTEAPSAPEQVRIQLPPLEEPAEAEPALESHPIAEEPLDPTPIPIPQPELPQEAFEEEILSEEELDALLASPIDDDRLEPVREAPVPEPSPAGLSNEELAVLEEEADWNLNVEVGTRSDLDEDLGPGKWVESGRSPEELARELDSMPVVEREFDLNPKAAALPRLLALVGVVLLGLLGFKLMGSSSEEAVVSSSRQPVEAAVTAAEIPEGIATTTVTTNLEHARVSLDGVEYGRAPASIPIPEDSEVHRLCVEYRTQSRCVELSAEELAARDPFQITVE